MLGKFSRLRQCRVTFLFALEAKLSKYLECTNFRILESGHIFHANLNRQHLIHFQKGMKGNKCNGRLLSPAGSHGSIAGSRAIRQWEKRDTEWEVLELLHGITSERKQELRQCDVWELKQRNKSGEFGAGFSNTFQPHHFSFPWPYFDDGWTHQSSVIVSSLLPKFISLYFYDFHLYFVHMEILLYKCIYIQIHIFFKFYYTIWLVSVTQTEKIPATVKSYH